MTLTPDHYLRRYRELTDNELLFFEPGELNEIARDCYYREIARRKIELPPEQSDETEEAEEPECLYQPIYPPPDSEEAMVQIALIDDSATASDCLSILHAANIPAILTESPGVPGRYAEACFGLLAAESCAESARSLVAGRLSWNNQELVRKWLEKDWLPDGMDLDEFQLIVDEYFGEEHKVAARFTVSGVDPHTASPVKCGGIAIVHLNDGRIGESWIRLDSPSAAATAS